MRLLLPVRHRSTNWRFSLPQRLPKLRKSFPFWAFVLFATLPILPGCRHLSESETLAPGNETPVGRLATNRYFTPTGQLLTPSGIQVELPEMRPQVLALSPDERLLVTAGKLNRLISVHPITGAIVQSLALTATEHGTNAPGVEIGLTGLTFAPDGKALYLSTADGSVRVFAVLGTNISKVPRIIALPEVQKGKKEAPSGLAVSRDNNRLYVAGNVANKLHEIDPSSGRTLRSWPTGVAPYEVLLVNGAAFVSNLGGPLPLDGELTAPAGRSSTVRVDPVRHIANSGSVTVIDLISGTVKAQIPLELHPSAMAVSPDGKYVVVANTGSDTLSVIDTATLKVVEKIWARQSPADLFGAQPTALAFDRLGNRLFVCNGTQNAVAVIRFRPARAASEMLGLIPAGWFPGAVVYHPSAKKLCVANIKGIGAAKNFKLDEDVKLTTKDYYGTVSLISLPSASRLRSMTRVALANMRYPRLAEAKLPARPGQPPRPVPERVGEPSVFKHVIYVIKENRTYDQVLGDMPEGNGNATLCTFGEKFTPNQHKIAREFVLLDNTYCSGVQSADGHQWTDSGLANAYIERQLTAGYPRSYPGAKAHDGIDALAWASSGFIWDNALAHGKTFRNYGEWMISEAGWTDKTKEKGDPTWLDFWNDLNHGTRRTQLKSKPAIESLRKYSKLDSVGWDLRVTDVARAAEFIKELRSFETNGNFPALTLIFLPNDHTGGAKEKYPTPGAQIADNDLAFGQIVEAVSRSKFWPETCLFAIEDDPQNGWDHVSGYRTTCYVVSPYTHRKKTVSVQYNQLSLLRTMELILGLPPMNQLDATATPMTECFTHVPDLTPFASVPNQVALDTINPDPKKVANPILRKDAIVSASLPLDEMDRCPEDVLNRILWRAMKGTEEPYPAWAVKLAADDDD